MNSSVPGWRCLGCRYRCSVLANQLSIGGGHFVCGIRFKSNWISASRTAVRRATGKTSLQAVGQTKLHKGKTKRILKPRSFKDIADSLSSTRRNNDVVEFYDVVLAEIRQMKLKATDLEYRQLIGLSDGDSSKLMETFTVKLSKLVHSWRGNDASTSPNYLALRAAFEESVLKMKQTLHYWAQHYIAQHQLPQTPAITSKLDKLINLRSPWEWFPLARQMQREIHLHIGPTNSGKTYHALKQLEKATSGIYAGPLRLLAHEVYNRLNATGRSCDLLTGEVRIATPRQDPNDQSTMMSCTVEMTPMNKVVDVAVIDEIQMMADEQRGKYWTFAFLGVAAKELHLCGEERTLPLIQSLCATLGDKLHVHRYERLNPLEVMPRSLNGDLGQLEKGDCVVAFSKKAIHALRGMIERQTGKKVAIIYGKLPPETRAQQAALFNDQNNDYDFLVASDAVGMGLNLHIKRIIFADTWKRNGTRMLRLQDAQLKQIAGRAGRFRVAPSPYTQSSPEAATENDLPASQSSRHDMDPTRAAGLVTALSKLDMPFVQRGIEAAASPLEYAGMSPSREILAEFANLYPPSTPLSYILNRLSDITQLASQFRTCRETEACRIADIIQKCPALSLQDRLSFCEAPISSRAELIPVVLAIARRVEKHQQAPLLELDEIKVELLDQQEAFDDHYLHELELLHESLVIYLWLSYRFDSILVSRPLANHVKGLVEERIEMALAALAHSEQDLEKSRRTRERRILQSLMANVMQGSEMKVANERSSTLEMSSEILSGSPNTLSTVSDT